MSLGTYGGTMRGGNNESTVVVADAPIVAPPVVSRGWSAIVVHPRYWGALRCKLQPDGVVVFDSSFKKEFEKDFEKDFKKEREEGVGVAREFPVDASAIARDADAARAGSLVLLGAYCAVTALVSLDSLVAAVAEALPSYRQQHLEANTRALAAGHRALPAGAAAAWQVAA